MYCSVRQYRTDAAKIDEMAHIVDEQFADTLSEQPGFVDYHVLDCGNGEVFAWTLFHDKEGAERATDLAAEFLRDKLGAFEITRTGAWTGEVKVSRTRSEVLDPVHA
jgi:hypothetical protein